jgi:imidazolonepropionase-like amidohydrolase/Tol biopolymer transport system component
MDRRKAGLTFVVLVTSIGLGVATIQSALRHKFDAPTRSIEFDTDEGTFINVDVSPDGKTLVFDLLGDIYSLPISGGTARPLLEGRPWDRCPRYSPDGRSIAFISDRGGPDGLWIWDLKAREGREIPVIEPPEANLIIGQTMASGSPVWLPNGHEIAFGVHDEKSRVRIAPTESGRPRWLEFSYPPEGAPKSALLGVYSATFTPEGRFAFFSETRSDSSLWTAQTSIYRLDLKTQQRVLLTEEKSDRQEFEPQISRSGKFLSYARRNGPGDTELRVRSLQTGVDRRLASIADCDPWRWGDRNGEMPAYAFTTDDRFIVIAFGGKLHKISVEDGTDTLIPFRLHVVREVAQPIRARYRIPDGPLQVRAIRWPSISPDKKELVFSAIGHLYIQELPDGKPRRLTDSEDFEYMPSLSPDGVTVAYVSFPRAADEVGPGSLMTLKLAGGTPRTVSSDGGAYFLPSWSPDGQRVAVIRQAGLAEDSPAEFGWIELATGGFHQVAHAAHIGSFRNQESYSQLASFSEDGSRLLFSSAHDRYHLVLESANLDRSDKREVAHADRDIRGILPSPDLSRAVLIGADEEAYVAELPSRVTESIALKIGDKRVQHVSDGCAYFPVWRGSSSFTYSCANRVFQYEVRDNKAVPPIEVDLRVRRKEGSDTVAFRNARIITVAGNWGAGPVIEHGTILVRGRRIAAVGESAAVPIPPEARIIDAVGYTIVPGLIDVHYHGLGDHSSKMTPLQAYSYLGDPSALAYGVTTGWDALGGKNDGPLSLAEMREAGRILGPRWFFAIEALNYYDFGPLPAIGSLKDASAMVQKRAANGVLQVLKEYDEPSRATAQWFAEAARQHGLAIAAHTEGLPHLLKRAADGYEIEHPNISAPLYNDVKQFLAQNGTIWTPNIITAVGTSMPRYAVENQLFPDLVRSRGIGESEKLDRYAGRFLQKWRSEEKLAVDLTIPVYEQTTAARVGQAAAAALAGGVKVAISGHNSPAILTHFEMWALHRGGAPNAEVIRAATMTGAEKLGIQQDVGSLEPGKIADFLVLTANPLDKIEDTLSLKYTIADGIVYNSDNLEEPLGKKPF